MIGAHWPLATPVSPTTQARHVVSQSVLQQTPSTQRWLAHSMPTVHVVPLAPPVDALDDTAVEATVVAVVLALADDTLVEALADVDADALTMAPDDEADATPLAVAAPLDADPDAGPASAPVLPRSALDADADAAPP